MSNDNNKEYIFNQLGLVTVLVVVFSFALINSCGAQWYVY